jgi:two-component system sensor histidine kinase KdpD
VRSFVSLCGVALVTLAGRTAIPANPATMGFAYLLLVLLVASAWGFVAASLASVAATLAFNFFFFPPVGTFTIADPQNWFALFTFLATALIASRLSAKAEQRARDAIERRQDVERLYSFSRAILLIGTTESFAGELARRLVEVFELDSALLYDRRTGEIHRAGPSDFEGLDDQLRDAALHGGSFSDTQHKRVITAVRLGSDPIASVALQGAHMPDSVVQGIANLVAIGLERARAQELAHQVEAAKQSEELRTTLIDAMAHEFKTPLTSIKAATTALLSSPDQSAQSRRELLTIADEEADHLKELIDDSIEMARLDTAHIDIHLELSNLSEIVREVAAATEAERPVTVTCGQELPAIPLDRRLVKLAVKQLLDNALKYSPPGTPVEVAVSAGGDSAVIEVTDHGEGISVPEQKRIFERFYRSPSVKHQIPGSGLGLSIAGSIARAHNGDLTVASRPGETTFRMALPRDHKGGQA